jgi:hypothetical protein
VELVEIEKELRKRVEFAEDGLRKEAAECNSLKRIDKGRLEVQTAQQIALLKAQKALAAIDAETIANGILTKFVPETGLLEGDDDEKYIDLDQLTTKELRRGKIEEAIYDTMCDCSVDGPGTGSYFTDWPNSQKRWFAHRAARRVETFLDAI